MTKKEPRLGVFKTTLKSGFTFGREERMLVLCEELRQHFLTVLGQYIYAQTLLWWSISSDLCSAFLDSFGLSSLDTTPGFRFRFRFDKIFA